MNAIAPKQHSRLHTLHWHWSKYNEASAFASLSFDIKRVIVHALRSVILCEELFEVALTDGRSQPV